MKKSVVLAIIGVFFCLFACAGCGKKTQSSGTHSYVFASVSRGTIEKTVSSSGALEPVSSVKVLAQMSGIVEKVNADYNDHIKKGQILAVLNTDMLKLQKKQQEAAVNKAKANYDLQHLNYQNQLKLAEKDLVSDYDLKSAKTSLDVLAADLSSAEASLEVIDTEINQYAYIKSPIDGIVLARNIDVGGSVVEGSSSNSSSLFTLADSLSKMQIEATVDELDIAGIKNGQAVRFTVEALPDRTFSGKVQTIHMVPATVNNVVTYTVVIKVENAEGSLLPGMTAEVVFIQQSKKNILTVPNAALRFTPASLTVSQIAEKIFYAGLEGLSEQDRAAAIAKHEKAKASAAAAGNASGAQRTGLAGMLLGGRSGAFRRNGKPAGNGATGNHSAEAAAPIIKNIWYVNDKGELNVIPVTIGVSDGTNTEIMSDRKIEGMKIILKEKA